MAGTGGLLEHENHGMRQAANICGLNMTKRLLFNMIERILMSSPLESAMLKIF